MANKDEPVTLTIIMNKSEDYQDLYGAEARVCLSGLRVLKRPLFFDNRNLTFTTGMGCRYYDRYDRTLIEGWKMAYANTEADINKFDELFEEIQKRFDWLLEYDWKTGTGIVQEDVLKCFCGNSAKLRGNNADGESVVLCDEHYIYKKNDTCLL